MLTDTISLFRKIKFEREQLKQLMYAWTLIIILYEKQQAKCILKVPNSKKHVHFVLNFLWSEDRMTFTALLEPNWV